MPTTTPFSQDVLQLLSRPRSDDPNYVGSMASVTVREVFDRTFLSRRIGTAVDPDFSDDTGVALQTGTFPALTAGSEVGGFLGDGFKVDSNAVGVSLRPGLGFQVAGSDQPTAIGGVAGVDDTARLKPLPLRGPGVQVLQPDSNNSGLARVDVVEVRYDRRLEQPASRDLFDAILKKFFPQMVNTALSWTMDGRIGKVAFNAPSTAAISVKTGNPGAGRPPVTAGYVKVAELLVANGYNFGNPLGIANIVDCRAILFPGNQGRVTGSCFASWAGGAATPVVAAAGANLGRFSAPPGVLAAFVPVPNATMFGNVPGPNLCLAVVAGAHGFPVAGGAIATLAAFIGFAQLNPDVQIVDAAAQAAFAAATPPLVVAQGQPMLVVAAGAMADFLPVGSAYVSWDLDFVNWE